MNKTNKARQARAGTLAILSAAVLGVSCAGIQAGSIGMNFVDNGDGGIQNSATDSLTSTEQAGAPGYEQANWNNLGRWGGGSEMVDSTGTATGVKVWWDSNNTWHSGSTATPDEKLMYGYLDSTGQINYDLGSYQFWWNENKPEVYVEGLSAWMASIGAVDYDVVVYADGDSTGGRKAEYWLQQAAGPGGNAPTSLGPDLTPHVFITDTANFADSYSQVSLSANSVDNAGSGNYIVFPNVSSDNFILRTEERYFRAFLNGFQIIPHLTATAPSIVTDISSPTVYSGRKAVFTVSAVGTPPLQYQWTKVGSGDIAGATNATLVFTNASLSDNNSMYTVKISNKAGSVTSGNGFLVVMDSALSKFTWSAPVTLTTADEALNKPGVIAGAASFGGHQLYVTNGSSVINFTTDGSVALTSGNGSVNGDKVCTVDTGNAQLNEVLDYFSADGGPKTITLYNLVPGLNYTVQLFAMDNRSITVGGQTCYFVDPNDEVDYSDTMANHDQAYIIGSFKASSTTETIKMVLPYDNNGALNAAIVRVQQAAPAFSINPVSMTVYNGQTVTLTSLAVGGAPLEYQWRKGGTAITGATNASITLTNVTSTATYDVVVKNAAGSATSTPATVTVLSSLANGTFAAAVMANSPLAYWRLNESSSSTVALDYASGINGTYGETAVWGSGVPGPRPSDFTGFEGGNSGLQCAGASNSYVTVPAVNLNTNTVTIVAWINPTAPQVGYTGLVMSRDGVSAGLGFSGVANELAYTWNSDSTWTLHSGLIVPQNEWSMVALVIEPTQGTLYMANAESGLVSAVNPIAHIVEKWIGKTRIGGDSVDSVTRTFVGSMDEVAVFNHALNKNQLLAMWAAGRSSGNLPPVIVENPHPEKVYNGRPAHFTVSATASGTISYQWRKNGANLTDGANVSGATTSTLTLNSVSASDNGTYSVVVANNAGSVTSTDASFEAVTPTGKAFEAAVMNANPFGYWRFSEIAGTNAFDYYGGNAGIYHESAYLAQPGNTEGGFESDNIAMGTVTKVTDSYVTLRPLNFNTNTMTVAAWIQPNQEVEPGSCGIFFQREGITVSGLTYSGTGTNLSYTWNNEGGTYGWDSGLTIPSGQWVFVAMVIEPTKATLYMGTNGTLVGAFHNYVHVTQPFDRTSYVGNDPSDAAGARIFNGQIDELVIAPRAFTGEEIAQLYAAGAGVTVAPQINKQPVGVTVYAGNPAQFNVQASGSPTLKYQWYKGTTALTDGDNVTGSTTTTLSIKAATAADAGSYKVVVSNGAGSATSTVVALNVGVTDGKAYETAVLAGNPVAYWRFNETSGTTAFDYIGGFNGTYGDAVTRNVPGPVVADMAGFEEGNLAFQTTGVTNSYVITPALSLKTNAVTIVAWIYPTDNQPDWSGIVFTRGDDVGGMCFRDGGSTEVGYTWNDARYDWSSGLKAPVNQWSMMTLVISPTNAMLYMGNSSGVVSAENKATHAVEGWTSPIRIGGDPQNAAGRTAKCIIDEVAIYKYAMGDAQVRNLYAQASTGGQTPSVTLTVTKTESNVTLTWSNGTLLEADEINGTWTPVSGATSPYTLAPSDAKKFFRVLVK